MKMNQTNTQLVYWQSGLYQDIAQWPQPALDTSTRVSPHTETVIIPELFIVLVRDYLI